MSDEQALLAAIRAMPEEDTPRLAYADWLDEHRRSDQHEARAEFIRLGCRKAYKVQPRAVGAWLDANWQRLFPHALSARLPDDALPAGRPGRPAAFLDHPIRTGRRVDYLLPWRKTRFTVYAERLVVELWRGFATRFYAGSVRQFYFWAGLLAADDPLVVPYWLAPPMRVGRPLIDGAIRLAVSFGRGDLGPLIDHVECDDPHYVHAPGGRPEYAMARFLDEPLTSAQEKAAGSSALSANAMRTYFLEERARRELDRAGVRWMRRHRGECWIRWGQEWQPAAPPIVETAAGYTAPPTDADDPDHDYTPPARPPAADEEPPGSTWGGPA
jgi:uncharacterized protein (TIGR02996 family)